jgi:glycosyltransferase involved in cell wall biosynthesis
VRWRAGEWPAARDELRAAVAADPRPTARRLLDRVEQDLRAVTPGWLPEVAPRSSAPPLPGRVVHLLNNSLPHVQAGYTVRAQRIALAQQTEGLDPVLVTKLGFPWRQGIGDAPEVETVDGVTYRHVRDPGGDTVFGTAERVERAVDRVGPVVAALRPAVLHPTSPFDNAQLALALGRRLGVPVVYELRGFLEETWVSRAGSPEAVAAALASDRYRLTRATEGWCAAAADHVVTLGEAMKADLVGRGVPAERITVVPNAVDLEAFTPSPDRTLGRTVRSRLGVPDGRVVLGYVSSLVPYEGVEVLLRAARELLDRGADVEVLVVGDGTARAGWEREAAGLGLGARCHFTGRVPHADIRGYYEAIDVFVVPRRNERVCRLVTPLKPVEAMALERCVVVSDVPALVEMVEEGVTGCTFAAEDPVALADVVAPLLDDPDRRAALGAAARERVAAERTWAVNGARYAALYRGLGVA